MKITDLFPHLYVWKCMVQCMVKKMYGKERFVYFYYSKLIFLKNTKLMYLDSMATSDCYESF